jgi:hypothetical protein
VKRLALLLPLWAALCGCEATRGFFDSSEYPISEAERDNAATYLEVAEQELEGGQTWHAVRRLIAVREIQNLPPEVRLRSEELIDRGAQELLRQAEAPDSNLGLLEDLWGLDLSPRMRASAGVRYAERLLEEGRRVSAYKQIRTVEEELPNHGERARAGRVLAEAGLSMIQDPGRYYLIMTYAARGAAALEFLVLTYPLDPACPAAYAALARYYTDEDELELAIARHGDLLLYHPSSPEAVDSEAAIPRLRLERAERPDHDRSELVRALSETQAWLLRHPGAPLEAEVRATEQRCYRMLAESDLRLSRYYRTTGSSFGSRMHAERALSEARQAEDPEREGEAQALLAELGPPPGAPAEESPAPAEPARPAEPAENGGS